MDELSEELGDVSEDTKVRVQASFGRLKVLDRCRALHAEEHAILNAARLGTSLSMKECVLFTTTYPCNLCANKIVQVGIRDIVYFEAYPGDQARQVLDAGKVRQRTFQGVTHHGYFKLSGRDSL